jgi:hypothetical protein
VEAFTQVSPIITAPSSPNRSQATSADITTKQLNHEDNARIPGGVSEIVAVEETDDIRMNEGDSEPISRSDLFLPSSDVTETTEDPECQSSIAQSVHEVAEEVDLSSEIACISAAEVDKTQTTCSIAATIADGTVITQENGSESQNPVTTSSNNLLAVELIAKNPLELLQLRLDSLPPSDNGSSSDEHIQLSTAAVFSNNIEHDTICMAIPDKSPILQEHTVLLRTLLPQETFQSSDSYSTTSETPCGTVAKTRSAGDKANELITPIVERIADPISSDNCDSKTGIVVSGGNFEQDRGSNQDSVKTKGDTILINDYDDDDDDIPPPAHEPDTVTTRRPTSAEPMTLADDTFCRSFTSSCIGDILQTLPVSVLSAVESTVTESTAAVRNGPQMANDVLSEYDMLGTEELLKLREELRQEIASIEREIQAISKT